ncbi:MAG: ATP-binding protein, partial [Planctomycetota bacterium]|nr:ATP-binding protein [Planctomycetota bacterium]MDI6788047.1 ATP-binding protein [Planctomycetota bacterium]
MSIFTKHINEITYDDVVSFCQQGIAEGINLDYKKDFPPSGLEKTISAFANSFSGVIIIGVEDKDSKPNPPFEGIDYKDKLEERVWNIILDNIQPPVFPEIRVCPPKNNKTFVVIRIPQSNETPHAILNNTQVYLRTGNRNKPEDIATVEQIEWLRNRRRKSEELKEILYHRAEERYQNICNSRKVKIKSGEFTLSFSPLYPQRPLLKVEEIEETTRAMQVSAHGWEFPFLHNELFRPVQDGMILFFLNDQSGFIAHIEINKFGLIFYKE